MQQERSARPEPPVVGKDAKAPADPLVDLAAAKVNLTLEICGRRSDGYHEIVSLVAFADVSDRLALAPHHARDVGLDVFGPFAIALDGENLVLRAARAFLDAFPETRGGRFALDKRLPVAAGVGGGSADAAAAVRLLARANALAGCAERADLDALTPALSRLGADIPVCMWARASWMTGIGERVTPLSAIPDAHAVLVNPGVPLPTRDVFGALDAPALADRQAPVPALPGAFDDLDSLVSFLNERRNDLEPPARALAPVIGEVLNTLAAAPGCLIARLSGSGPTCFGLFATPDAAQAAASRLTDGHPQWWIAPARLS